MRLKQIFIALVVTLATVACGSKVIIPDDELAEIFSEVYLTNAAINNQNFVIDSLNIYEPIFARHGYTTLDVQNTIGNFARRKSARLSHIVDRAVELLEDDADRFNHEVAILDTVNNVAQRAFTRRVFHDTTYRARAIKDTADLKIMIDSLGVGDYQISIDYFVDSLDKNKYLRGKVWMERRDSSEFNSYTFSLFKLREQNFKRTIKADTFAHRLYIQLLDYRDKPQKTHVDYSDVSVVYVPEFDLAVDSLYAKQLDIRLFADEFFSDIIPTPKDSI